MENFMHYIALLLIIIVGFFVVKRVAGCMLRTVVTLILMAVLAFLYFKYFRGSGLSLQSLIGDGLIDKLVSSLIS